MTGKPFGLRCDEGPGQGGSALPDERRPTSQRESQDEKEGEMKGMFIKSKGIPFEELKPDVHRRILGYIDNLMAVEVRFQKGAIGEVHSHRHAQTGYVLEGSFQVEVEGKKEVLKRGDCYFAEPHIMHGVVCLEDDSTLLDIFTPIREDFLK